MSFDLGIDFRATAGFVTDPAGSTYCIGDTYPTTRGGATFGWVGTPSTRDRQSAVDHRLSGVNFSTTPGDYFQLDLPASGSTTVHLALGDTDSSNTNGADLKDGTTLLRSYTAAYAGNFEDAAQVVYSPAAWPGSETGFAVTMTGTALRIYCSSFLIVAHLRAVQAGGGSTVSGAGLSLGLATVTAAVATTDAAAGVSDPRSVVKAAGAVTDAAPARTESRSVASAPGKVTASAAGASVARALSGAVGTVTATAPGCTLGLSVVVGPPVGTLTVAVAGLAGGLSVVGGAAPVVTPRPWRTFVCDGTAGAVFNLTSTIDFYL